MEAEITYKKNGGTVTTAAFENKVATTGLTGTKVWLDGGREDAERGNVELTLYQYVLADGKDAAEKMEEYEPVWTKPGDSNVWTWAYTNLPRFNTERQELAYYVVETPVNGYLTSQTAGDDGTTVITNTQSTRISGQKTWAQAKMLVTRKFCRIRSRCSCCKTISNTAHR